MILAASFTSIIFYANFTQLTLFLPLLFMAEWDSLEASDPNGVCMAFLAVLTTILWERDLMVSGICLCDPSSFWLPFFALKFRKVGCCVVEIVGTAPGFKTFLNLYFNPMEAMRLGLASKHSGLK